MAYALVKKACTLVQKPEEALIYLYDGPMVGMSELGSVQVMASLCASYGASNRPYDHCRGR